MPREVTARAGLARVELGWSPSGAYSAHGYEVSRATAADGPYKSIYSTTRWVTPFHTDTGVEPGVAYYYKVAALNHAGKSAPSAAVRATPAIGGPLPKAYQAVSIEGAVFSEVAGNSFVVPASGRDLDGSFTGHAVSGDFSFTARLVNWQGPVGMMGLTVREEGENKKARAMAVTLGEVGGRLARFRTRDGVGKVVTQRGCDYTWLPVWFRLQRAGDEFTAYQSPDGIDWFVIGSSKVSLPGKVWVGLLVSGGRTPPGRKTSEPPRGVFDHVVLEPRVPDAPSAPIGLTATELGQGVVRLEWQNASHGATASGVRIEASLDGSPFHEIADLAAGAIRFENTGIRKPSAIRYRIRTANTGGYSAYSRIVPCDSNAIPSPRAEGFLR